MVVDGTLVLHLPISVLRLDIPTMPLKKTIFQQTWAGGFTYTKVFDEINKISFGVDVHKLLVPTPPLVIPVTMQQILSDYCRLSQ